MGRNNLYVDRKMLLMVMVVVDVVVVGQTTENKAERNCREKCHKIDGEPGRGQKVPETCCSRLWSKNVEEGLAVVNSKQKVYRIRRREGIHEDMKRKGQLRVP